MILAIDLGNSRIKWAVHPGDLPVTGRFASAGSVAGASLDAALPAWSAVDQLREIVVCSVAETALEHAIDRVAARLGVPVRTVRARACSAGVRNLYLDPAQLGADRWAALIGARARSHSASLVVDVGTAMTVDALAADGRFLGGLIVAGYDLMRGALAQGTARLPNQEGEYHPLARSTQDAIVTGALQALAGAVQRTREAIIADGHGAPRLLMTGGAAERLALLLQPFSPVVAPQLVLEGAVTMAIEDRAGDVCSGDGR